MIDIQIEKLGLIEWITKLEDSSIIEKLIEIRSEYIKASDWFDELSYEEKQSIKRGLKNIEERKLHSHEAVKKIYEKYL